LVRVNVGNPTIVYIFERALFHCVKPFYHEMICLYNRVTSFHLDPSDMNNATRPSLHSLGFLINLLILHVCLN
jgi:hypothetical protein